MKRPAPPRQRRHSTVADIAPKTHVHRPRPQARRLRSRATARPSAGRLIDPDDQSLLDVIDNLLGKGVVLNAELVLALADVDLVFIRLSALLCAADRVLPPRRPR